MLSGRRRLAAVSALYGLMVLVIGWTFFHYPKRDRQLFLAIPRDSILVADVRSFSAWVQHVRENPLLGHVLAEAVGASQSSSVTSSDVLRFLTERLGDERVAMGMSAEGGGHRWPVYYAAVRLGWQSRLSALLSMLGRLPALERMESPHSEIVAFKVRGTPYVLSVTTMDGLLLGSLGYSANGAATMLHRLRTGGDLPRLLPTGAVDVAGRDDLSVWVDQRLGQQWVTCRSDLDVSLGNVSAETLTLTIRAEGMAANVPGVFAGPGAEGQERFAHSVAALKISGRALLTKVEATFPGLVAMMNVNVTGPATFQLTGGAGAGTLGGLRVPALTLTAAVASDDYEGDWLPVLLDRLNKEYDLELSAVRVSSSKGLYAINDAEGRGLLGQIKPNERFGVAMMNHQVALSSNHSVLWGQIEQINAVESDLSVDATCKLFFEADVASLRDSLSDLFAVIGLVQRQSESREASARVDHLAREIDSWLTAMAPMKRIELSIDDLGTYDRILLSLGE